jgi:hypothetical protein
MKRAGLVWAVVLCAIISAGCGEKLKTRDSIVSRYERTVLKQSTSSDVLSYVQDPNVEHLSQSESVVASWADVNKTRTHWFNIVVFDEENLTAVRKYGFTMADYRGWNTKPRPHIQLDIEVVLDKETLNAVYASQNEMRIEIIKKLKKTFFDDSQTVNYDSETLSRSAMVVTQTLNNMLYKLEKSPGLADDLQKLTGFEFDLMNIGTEKGHARMLIKDDIVKLKIKGGYVWYLFGKDFEDYDDVQNMDQTQPQTQN